MDKIRYELKINYEYKSIYEPSESSTFGNRKIFTSENKRELLAIVEQLRNSREISYTLQKITEQWNYDFSCYEIREIQVIKEGR
ncbi:MAG: hypothetical protein ACRCX2_36555 [Paraclostridium sp.]